MLHFAELTQHERVGTFTSNGRPVSGIFASISEFERELIRDCKVGAGGSEAEGLAPGQTRCSGISSAIEGN